ncbi:MAG: stress response translation initiation inhibitor YciH [Thermoplasmata archaeon]
MAEEVCPTCGLPKEICICEDIAREQQEIEIFTDQRRYGKKVTIVDGIDTSDIDIGELASELKTKCAAGGTTKDGRIELQGDHIDTVKEYLEEKGFPVEVR